MERRVRRFGPNRQGYVRENNRGFPECPELPFRISAFHEPILMPLTSDSPQRCLPEFAYRTEVFDNANVKGSEFLRKVRAVARRNKLTYRWVPERGSGSHGTLYVGTRFTVVKDLKKELGPGLLSDMLKQLGIRKEDL